MRYLLIIAALFCSLPQISAQNNIAYGAGISYTNGAPSFTPPARTSRVAIDTITGKWYHYNTPGGWQLLGNTIEEIAGCSAPAYTPTKGDSKVVINNCTAPELYYWTGSAWVWINEGTTYFAGEGIRIENDTIILDSLELNELHDVFVPNPINNQVLTWDNINKRWEAKTVADSSATNELQTLSVASNKVSLSSGGSVTFKGEGINAVSTVGDTIKITGTEIDGSTTNELQTISVASNTVTLSNSGGSVTITGAGINTVGTAGTTITVTGTEVDGSVSNELQTLSTGTNTLTLSNSGGTVTVDTDPASDVTGSGANGQVSFWTGAQTQNGDNGLFWNNTTKRLGIGTNTPGQLLDIVSSGQSLLRIKGGTGTNQGSAHYFTAAGSSLTLFAYGDEAAIVGGTPDQSAMLFTNAGIPLKFRLGASSVSAFTFTANGRLLAGTQTDDGFRLNIVGASRFADNLSIGTTSSAARLHVVGENTSNTGWTAQFHNSSTSNSLMIRNDGFVGIGTSTSQGVVGITPFEVNGRGRFYGGVEFGSSAVARISNTGDYYKSASGSDGFGFYNNLNLNPTTGTYGWAIFQTGISPTSGNATISTIALRPTINITGTATTAATGIDYNPTITSIGSGFHYAALFRSGNVGIGTATPTDQLHTTSTVRLEGYPNTLNSTGSPVNVLSTSSTGVVESHPVSEIVTSGGGLTGNGVAGYLPQYNTTSTLDTTGVFWNATTGRLGIGTSSPSSTLTVSGRIEPVNIGNSIFIGENTGRVDDLSDNRNIFIGWRAGYNNTTGSENLFEGYEAGYSNTEGIRNLFQGAYAGRQNTTGGGNIFQGYEAGYSSTSSLSNLVQGNQAGRGLTTGYQNIIQGQQAGFSIAGGFRNVFQGFQAGYSTTGSGNLMQGYQAGEFTTTGNFNNFQGFDAGVNNTTGSNNVVNGAEAGKFIGTGTTANTILNNSIIIGYDSRSLADNQTNQVVIGYQGRGLGSNTTVLGNDATTQTWLGGSLTLGLRSTPAARLHVVGSGSTSSTWTAQFHNNATGGNNALMVRNDGIVSIGTASPNGSGVLEISSTTQGVLFPRMTTAQRDLIGTPADGLVIYNTTANKLQVRAAGVWVDLH